MRIALAFILFLAISIDGNAQQLDPILSGDQTGHTIGIYGSGSVRSNLLRVKFTRDLYTGKSLDRDLRETQANAANTNNRIGGDLNYGIYYRHLPDSVTAGMGWGIQAGARIHANASFTGDAYKLAMLGNASFAGQVADFSNTRFNLFDYKYFGASLIKDFPIKDGHFRLGLSANFLLAQRHASASFDNTWLFTQEHGEYLDLSFNGGVKNNGLGAGQYFGANGYGVSANILLQMVKPKHTLSLEIGDAGALFMSNQGKMVSLDTALRFEGIELDLFGSGSEPFSDLSPDSLTEMLGIQNDSGAYNAVLPMYFHVRSEHVLGDGKYTVFGGVQYRLAPYFPLLYVGAKFNLPKDFGIQPSFAWGGYGSWNVGLELTKKFKQRASLTLGTNNLEGLIVTKLATGQGAYLKLDIHF